jgi:photosystem II stability/assembly factor-like uncharacterized protein
MAAMRGLVAVLTTLFIGPTFSFLGALASMGQEASVARLLVATSEGPRKSYSWGEYWQEVGASLPRGIATFACIGPRAFAGGPAGLYVSDDYGEDWRAAERWPGGEVTAFSFPRLFAAEPVVFAGTGRGLFRSRDGGERWERVGEGVIEGRVAQLVWPGPALFAATSDGLYRSDDGGRDWRRLGPELPRRDLVAIALSQFFAVDPTGFVGTRGAGLYRTKDGGESFHPIGGEAWAKRTVQALFWWESSLFAGTESGLFYSEDAGATFRSAGDVFDGLSVYSLAFPGAGTGSGSDILAGTSRGVFKSSDGARTWRHLKDKLGEPAVWGFGTFPFMPRSRSPL